MKVKSPHEFYLRCGCLSKKCSFRRLGSSNSHFSCVTQDIIIMIISTIIHIIIIIIIVIVIIREIQIRTHYTDTRIPVHMPTYLVLTRGCAHALVGARALVGACTPACLPARAHVCACGHAARARSPKACTLLLLL